MMAATITPVTNISLSTISPPIEAALCYFEDSAATRSGRILAYSIIMVTSLIANSLVLVVFRRDKKMKKPINYFIINLCCSDLFITAVYMPRLLVTFAIGFEWQLHGVLGIISCKIVAFVYETAVTVSILTVVVISLERYLLLVFPLKTVVSVRSAELVIAILWMVAILFRWPIAYGIKLYSKEEKLFCHLKLDEVFREGSAKLYYNVILIALYAVPLFLIFIFYSVIIITLRRRKSPGQGMRQDKDNRKKKRDLRMLKMVMIVIAVFVICWLLYFIRFIILSYGVQVSCDLLFASFVLAHSNSAITPCLYFVFNENFRRGLQSLLGLEKVMKRFHSTSISDSSTNCGGRGGSDFIQELDTINSKKTSIQTISFQLKKERRSNLGKAVFAQNMS